MKDRKELLDIEALEKVGLGAYYTDHGICS